MKDISIVIVNWNTASLLLDCLESVYAHADGLDLEVFVVDNASADGSAAAVRTLFPNATLIENCENAGFARANNLALKRCSGRYAVLLNSDTRLFSGTLRAFVDLMDRERDVAACCGQLYHGDGTKQNSFSVFPSLATELLNKSLLKILLPRWYPAKWGKYEKPTDIDAVIGACMAVRMSALGDVGLFDEDFFFFFEETDWCRRARAKGKRIVFVPSARITHIQGQSVSRDLVSASIEYYRSRYIYFRKHAGIVVRGVLRAGLMIRLLADMLLNAAGILCTAGLASRYRSKFRIFFGIIRWHLRGCPSTDGLREARVSSPCIQLRGGKWQLSVCVITCNEERNIGACLESVRWADEIIVLDSASTDNTVDIARRHTGKVFQSAWEGFSANKNKCIDLAANPWILVIDADERVTPELKNEICSLPAGADGYYVARKNFFLGKWIRFCGWYPDYSVRLFRAGVGRFGERSVHEAVRVDGRVEKLAQPLLHYTYTSVPQFVARLNRYAALAAQELYKKRPAGGGPAALGVVVMNALTRPLFNFIKMYLLKLGACDGVYGFMISFFYSYYVFMKYALLWEMVAKQETVK
ncbi:MAG TPA: glycosyltransferase [bacterium]|nr:glycosyltransferase [bacterium]